MDLKSVDNMDLIAYIASHQVFKVNKDLAKECMEELISRASSPENIQEFQNLIDQEVSKLNDIINKKRFN